jgi:hypothetical protein
VPVLLNVIEGLPKVVEVNTFMVPALLKIDAWLSASEKPFGARKSIVPWFTNTPCD